MSRPSTPSGRSNLMEKLFNKIRTPTSSSEAQRSIGASSSSPFSLSTASLLRRNSSRSSFHCGGSSAMASTSSLASNSSSLAAGALGALDFEDDNDVPLPEFESDAYLSNASWNDNGSSVKASSPTFPSSSPSTSRTAVNAGAGAISQPRPSFSSSGGRPSFDQLDGPLNNPPRSSSSMSRHSPPLPFSNPLLRSNTSANSGGGSGSSSGIGSVGVDSSVTAEEIDLYQSGCGKRERFDFKADLVNGAEGEDGAAHAEDARKTNEMDSRSSPTLASSLSHSRVTLERRTSNDRILSASQPALSTFATTTPALPRPGLTASTKATGERTGGTEVKKRRAQRVNLQELMAKKERDGLEGPISDAGDHGRVVSQLSRFSDPGLPVAQHIDHFHDPFELYSIRIECFAAVTTAPFAAQSIPI
ncbi:BZ3501_MvSof-1269-A2-R1_C43g00210 [Microbotryum saponariae]|nr:BZ3501_MvSof-1269-A2-R1_C43g00210 [Microbotryum saponariae]